MGAETTAMPAMGGVEVANGQEVDRLRRQVEVMLAYALDKGLTPAPQGWMFDAVRPQPLVELTAEGWVQAGSELDRRAATDALVRAHRDLSRLVAPARPATLELLQAYRDSRRPNRSARIPRQQPRSSGAPGGSSAGPAGTPSRQRLRLRRPHLPGIGSTVPLVRALVVATLAFLAFFVLFAASPDARSAISGPVRLSSGTGVDAAGTLGGGRTIADRGLGGGAGMAPAAAGAARARVAGLGGPSFGRLLTRELFLLSAAGLGACFTALYRASRDVARGTYDPEFDHTFLQRIVLGMATGLLVGEMLPIGNAAGLYATLARPALALLGGFGAGVAHRVLSRAVAALETLFSGDADEQEDSRRELAQKRVDEVVVQAERAALARLLEIRRIAASGAPTRAVIDEIDHMITQVTSV